MRAEVAEWLPGLFSGAPCGWMGFDVQRLRAGRGEVVTMKAGEIAVLIRPCRRGGLPGRILHDVYFGWNPRPVRELRLSVTLRQSGAPVVEVFGAAVQWLAPGCYRGWLASRFLPDAVTLWQWAQAKPSEPERRRVFEATGAAIRNLYDCGGRHPDLNLSNVLVQPPGSVPRIVIIDLDRAAAGGGGPKLDAMLERLARSARKLDPDGRCLNVSDLDQIAFAARDRSPG